MAKRAAIVLLMLLFMGFSLLIAWAEVGLFTDMVQLQAHRFYVLIHSEPTD